MASLFRQSNLPHRYSRLFVESASWLTFAVALTFYWITADPGVSYWDCPEYVTVASRMEIGHSPGNPMWMLAMRVATIPFAPEHHAYVINLCSGVFMAFASFFLCRVIFTGLTAVSDKWRLDPGNIRKNFIIAIISFGASLCFALCDSAWYSAVEAEVYAMSAFLSALSLWIMCLWWQEKSRARRIRLLILIAYITGISLGVHQLNLLLIPVFLLAIIYKRNPGKISAPQLILWLAMSLSVVGVLLMLLLPLTLQGAGQLELFGVNTLRMPYNSGVIMFGCLLLIILVLLLFIFDKTGLRKLNVATWCLAFVLLGFSSYGIIMIRGAANPPLNVGNPGNIFTLSSYINRDQYPKTPLIYGHTPYSRPLFEEQIADGKPRYNRYILEKGKRDYLPLMPGALFNHRSRMLSHEDSLKNKAVVENGYGYVLSDFVIRQKLTPELDMWFPRITSRDIGDRREYEEWVGMNEKTMERISISETIDSTGTPRPRMYGDEGRPEVMSYRPTYAQNLEYFIKYQTFYMYFRYLFWNFIGRQNDYHSTGEIEHGNFITGFEVIDRMMVGDRNIVPKEIGKGNKGYNRYFGIPFLFGILGIIWMLSGNRKRRRLFGLSFLLFLMTSLAIVAYLNQTPGEARERDYTFLVSYMAFVMWIAAGFMCVARWLFKWKNQKFALVIMCVIGIAPCTLMALENFDDHDRRHRFEPTFYATSLLDFELPAIIFSHGDNSSFPLWYATEVLEMGENHTPIDITYLSLPSYVENLKKQGRRGVSTILSTPEFAYGKFLFAKIPEEGEEPVMSLDKALGGLYSSKENIPAFPTSKIFLPRSKGDSVVVNLKDFTGGSSLMGFKHIMLLDLIATQISSQNPKVLYFPSLLEKKFAGALDSVLSPAIFGKIYAPWMSDSTLHVLMKRGVERELAKLHNLDIKEHYNEPFIDDRSRRYRGELIMAATNLLETGDTLLPEKIADIIILRYPYASLLPGSFTVADTTYYEGVEFLSLLNTLADYNPRFHGYSQSLDSLNEARRKEWLNYYNSLTKSQRSKLSPRSRRLLRPT